MTKIFNHTSKKKQRRYLRSNMPTAEILLWSKIKSKQLKGLKFRRQYSIGDYIVDFYCPNLKLVIEIDGDSHAGEAAQQSDQERQKYIEGFGFLFLRFTNQEIYKNLDGVLGKIAEKCDELNKLN